MSGLGPYVSANLFLELIFVILSQLFSQVLLLLLALAPLLLGLKIPLVRARRVPHRLYCFVVGVQAEADPRVERSLGLHRAVNVPRLL